MSRHPEIGKDEPLQPMPDETVVTACQAACPTEAIVFGDLARSDDSRVSRASTADRRQYTLLPEVYTKPRNRYLARVRNPNPDMMASQQRRSRWGAE